MVVLLPLCVAMAATAGRASTDDLETIELCSDDAAETGAGFVRTTLQVLAESKIRLLFRCGATSSPTATFVTDESGVLVELRSPNGELSARSVPWLRDLHHPLASTLALGKATTLGLFLGNLAGDLQAMPLRRLPGPAPLPMRAPSPAPSVAARPEEEPSTSITPAPMVAPPAPPPSEPAVLAAVPIVRTPVPPVLADVKTFPSAPPAPPAPPASPPASAAPGSSAPPVASVESPRSPARTVSSRRAFELALPLFGVGWMPLSTAAPQIEAGIGWGGPRWWATASAAVELDSNFAMAGRTFTTAGYAVRAGIRRTLLGSRRFRWDADATVVGHLNRYRRDGIPDAQRHDWLDLGAGLHSRTSLALGSHVSLVVVAGAQFFPTAREASIPGGPSQRINLVSLTAVGGPSFAF